MAKFLYRKRNAEFIKRLIFCRLLEPPYQARYNAWLKDHQERIAADARMGY